MLGLVFCKYSVRFGFVLVQQLGRKLFGGMDFALANDVIGNS